AVGERPVRHDADAVRLAIREDLALHAAVEQVPAVLRHVDSPHAHAGLDLPGAEVRDTDEAGLSLPDDVLEGAHRLLEGRNVVGPVDEVDVDAVGSEMLQALLDAGHATRAARVTEVRLVAVSDAELRDDDRLAPPPPERASERPLRGAQPVPLGGVEAGDAAVEGPPARPGGLPLPQTRGAPADFAAPPPEC